MTGEPPQPPATARRAAHGWVAAEAAGTVSRRRLLFASAGFMLLGLGASVSAREAGVPAALARAGRSGRRAGAAASPDPAGSASAAASPPPAPVPGEDWRPLPPIDVDPPRPPRPRAVTAPQYYVDDAGPNAIALTFDDGPDPLYTPQVLEILDRYGVQATFNMIGEQIEDNLPLVREVAAAGHTVTNHTWDHADMRAYPLARVLSEIDRCNDALAAAGQQPTIFRAPYGYWTPGVFEACAARGLTPLGWSVDPQDWDDKRVTARDIVRNVLRNTRRHDIVLEHDGGGDRSHTVAALRVFLPALLERGFVFTAV